MSRAGASRHPKGPEHCRQGAAASILENKSPAGTHQDQLAAYNGLLLKDSYWRWSERNLAGNAIDFFVQVHGLSFNDAMRQITGQ